MRDPKRIKRICQKLEELWNKYPDQRLGQLLANFVFNTGIDVFYQEDVITEERVNQ